MSCICLPLSSSFVCLAEITTRRWCSPRLYCVRLLSAHHVHPSRLLPPSLSLSLSLLHDWSFCHYFLAAGGDLGNLVNLLTTNCLLLPCCLDKQPGWGGVKPLWPIKVVAGRGGSHCHCMDPSGPDFLHVYWDFWTLDFYLLQAQRPVTHLFFSLWVTLSWVNHFLSLSCPDSFWFIRAAGGNVGQSVDALLVSLLLLDWSSYMGLDAQHASQPSKRRSKSTERKRSSSQSNHGKTPPSLTFV